MAPEQSGHRPDGPRRRRVLATLGAGATGVVPLPGCLGESDDETETRRSPDEGAESETETTDASTISEDSETATGTEEPESAVDDGENDGPVAHSGLDPGDYGPPASGEWERTLADHFDADGLDERIWSPGIEGHGSRCADGGGRSFCWAPDHVAVDAATDRLRLEVSDEAPPAGRRDPPDADVGYTVGAVNTRGAFAQEFGYFEAAARVPDEPGTLPAFWLFLDKFEHDWREIDVYEKNGAQDAHTLKMGAWFEQDDDGPEPPATEHRDNDDRIRVGAGDGTDEVEVADPVDETFHVYGLEWSPDALTWYVDGEQVGRVDHPGVAEYLPGQELFLVLNSAVWDGPDWIGSPSDATFPHYHEFEWVRAWQREEHS